LGAGAESDFDRAAVSLLRSARDTEQRFSADDYGAIRQRVQGLVLRRFPTLRDQIDDLTQESMGLFLRAARRGPEHPSGPPTPEGSLGGYLITIIERRCIAALRRRDPTPVESPDTMRPQDDAVAEVLARVDAGVLVEEARRAAVLAGDGTAAGVLQSWRDSDAGGSGRATVRAIARCAGRSEPTVRSVVRAFLRWHEDPDRRWKRE
jgi:DNA-directed RNA polymerase specialized sigma24 family protein